MMLPILISVSVAAVSYLFCASAPLLDPASTANAAAAIAILFLVSISVSLFPMMVCHGFLSKLFVTSVHRIPPCPGAHKKKPLRQSRRGCFFSSQLTVLAADVGADDVAEALPGFALESHELQLRERSEIGGAGVNLDAGQQAAEFKVLDARGLLHDVFAGEIVAAVLQHVHEALRDGVGVHHRKIGAISFRIVFIQERIPGLH